MDVEISELTARVEVRDIEAIRKALLDDPTFRAFLKQWREEDERLHAQRSNDRAASVKGAR
jgi:hypothetical protein